MCSLVALLKKQYFSIYPEEISFIESCFTEIVRNDPVFNTLGLSTTPINLDCLRSVLIVAVNDCLDEQRISDDLSLEIFLILEIILAGHAMHTKNNIDFDVKQKDNELSLAKRVLIGDYLLSYAYERLVTIGSIPLIKAFTNASIKTTEGEVLSIKYAGFAVTDNGVSKELIRLKTAPMFCLPVESHKILTGGGTNYKIFMDIIFDIAEIFHFLVGVDSVSNEKIFLYKSNSGDQRIFSLMNSVRLNLTHFPENKGKALINTILATFEQFIEIYIYR